MKGQNESKKIAVFADWEGLKGPARMGLLYAQRIRGKEIFAFEYDDNWLRSGFASYLDPNMGLYKGQQYLPDDKPNFGIFLDSSPDRWGRMLMRRREAFLASKEGRKENTLYESDYLLGVYDGNRMGGIRFKLENQDVFLNNNAMFASPPLTSLRELENASLWIEQENAPEDPESIKWFLMLIDPGSSLGGARPKASVTDEKGQLWIAKFPSRSDDADNGAWELVLHHLAKDCGIQVPEVQALRLNSNYHTFLSRRFDRSKKGNRIHFASAMTLLGYNDGAGYEDGVSYLELAEIIQRFGAQPKQDLEQLWRRILFNVSVSNTDDHLRNHGFLLSENGWQLSPAFDMNPNENGFGLKLNISENSNDLSVGLVMDVAKYFQLNDQQSMNILREFRKKITSWNLIAKKSGISSEERQRKEKAFRALQ